MSPLTPILPTPYTTSHLIRTSFIFFKDAQAGGRTWDLFDFRLFYILLDHSATAPPRTSFIRLIVQVFFQCVMAMFSLLQNVLMHENEHKSVWLTNPSDYIGPIVTWLESTSSLSISLQFTYLASVCRKNLTSANWSFNVVEISRLHLLQTRGTCGFPTRQFQNSMGWNKMTPWLESFILTKL